MPTENKNCFVIMPITTPEYQLTNYGNDKDHFKHVLECLFSSAVEKAGFILIPPEARGSEVIHAEIIKQLSTADLVLCDMSIFNPNVFFEFGIRTALNKPVALVIDDKTKPIPFDTGIINYFSYDSSLVNWLHNEQVEKLTKHIQESFEMSKQQNTLWKYFGIAQPGEFKSPPTSQEDKLSFIMERLNGLQNQIQESSGILQEIVKDKLRREIATQKFTVADLLAAQQVEKEKWINQKEIKKMFQEILNTQENPPKIEQEIQDAVKNPPKIAQEFRDTLKNAPKVAQKFQDVLDTAESSKIHPSKNKEKK